MDTTSKCTLKHEYNFLNDYILLFHAPTVQIFFFREKYKENKLIVKI